MDERYPIGGYETPTAPDQKQFIQWVETIESFPARLQKRLDGLDAGDLDAQYREGGWNIRQVIHHIADAMMNSYLHFKLATTEENPQIKPYEEVLWCEQEDEKRLSPEVSVALLDALVKRWSCLLRSLDGSDLKKTFVHPAAGQKRLLEYTAFCAWHGDHHIAHIDRALDGLKQKQNGS